MNNDVFGRGGHFTTSPEISQLFGEVSAAGHTHACHCFRADDASKCAQPRHGVSEISKESSRHDDAS